MPPKPRNHYWLRLPCCPPYHTGGEEQFLVKEVSTLSEAILIAEARLARRCIIGEAWWPATMIPDEQTICMGKAADDSECLLVYSGEKLVGTVWKMR